MIQPPPEGVIRLAVETALAEDRAAEDVTTLAAVTPSLRGTARFLAKQDGVLAGLPVALEAFRVFDPTAGLAVHVQEGGRFAARSILAEVTCSVRAMLQAERVALNFLQRLCGTATHTRAFVDAVAGTGAVILDTRKTTPGLRDLEKYAVRCGGGTNHRRDLAAMAMIKDNHREALARAEMSLADGVAAIRQRTPGVAVEVEIDALDQLEAVELFESFRRQVVRDHPTLGGALQVRRLLYETTRRMLSEQVHDVIHASRSALDLALPTSVDSVRQQPTLISFGPAMRRQSSQLKQFLLQNLYRHPQVSQTMVHARRVIADLFACYLAEPGQMQAGFASRSRASSGDPGDRSQVARVVADYIAGMTDRFAAREHERVTGQRLFA